MPRHRQRIRSTRYTRARLGGATVAIVLLVGSLLSFGLGQETRHLVRALGLAPRLDQAVARQIASRQATGALGIVPALPKSAPPTKKRATTRNTTALRQPTRRVASAPSAASSPGPEGCPDGTQIVEQQTSWQMTPQGESRFSITICAGDGGIGTPDMPPRPPEWSTAWSDSWSGAPSGWPPDEGVYGRPHAHPPAYAQPPYAPPAYAGYGTPPISAAPGYPSDDDAGSVGAGIEVHAGHHAVPPVMVVAPDTAG